MGRKKRRRRKWFSLEAVPEGEHSQASVGAPGVPPTEARAEGEGPPQGEEGAELRAEPGPETEIGEAIFDSEVPADAEGQLTSEAVAEIVTGPTVGAPENGEPEPASGMPADVHAQFVPEPPGVIEALAVPEAPPELEVVPEEEESALRDHRTETRRQYARFLIDGKAKGRVTAIYDAVVVDISMGGSLIEHAHVVRPGTMSSLDLELGGARVRLRCRVARSVVHRSEVLPGGERELIYRTGLQFLDPPEETRQMIIRYIRSVVRAQNDS